MSKDLFDIAVGLAQIITACGVLAAFEQVKVTQAQLEEEQKNSKPEVHIIAAKDGSGISVVAINVKNIPIFVKSYTVELIPSKRSDMFEKMAFFSPDVEKRFLFRSSGLGVRNIGEHCTVWVPNSFFCGPYRGEEPKNYISKDVWNEIERMDIIFNIPGISPYPRISFALNSRTAVVHTDEGIQYIKYLIVDQLTNDGYEQIAEWEIAREPFTGVKSYKS